MLQRKLVITGGLVAIIVAAAVAADYALNVVVLATPALFTPITTAVIATLVASPVGFLVISQHLDVRRVRGALAASLADRERAVIEAETALERLRESEATYRLLADNQTDVITLWTAEGRRKYTSPSVERAFGYTVGEIMALENTGNMHPDDVEMIRNLFRTLTVEAGTRTVEFRLLHKTGDVIWVEGTFQRLGDGSNCLLTTSRIIAERKQLESDLIDALDKANVALAVKSDFLANMTHELRTPLNAIIGFSGLLRQSRSLAPEDARRVELVSDASQTLLRIVDDVLDFSRLEDGAVEFEAQAFDPVQLARATVKLLGGEAKAKGLKLTLLARGPSARLVGDGPRLRQVLVNFIANAIKFTASGGIRVQVDLRLDGDNRLLRMAVADSGIGVPADRIDAIFGRFSQADASISREFGGAGLGLAISQRIIEGLRGRIGVESEVGEGSTFWFEVSMPLAVVSETGRAARADAPSVDRAARLLVVEDNEVNRELICALLKPFDLVIEVAGDGAQAVKAAARSQFDLILMDVQMPIMDGLTATRRIRAARNADAKRVPIIAMTANVLPEQVDRCLAAGMDDHIGKPINPSQLVETLARWSASPAPAEEIAVAVG